MYILSKLGKMSRRARNANASPNKKSEGLDRSLKRAADVTDQDLVDSQLIYCKTKDKMDTASVAR